MESDELKLRRIGLSNSRVLRFSSYDAVVFQILRFLNKDSWTLQDTSRPLDLGPHVDAITTAA